MGEDGKGVWEERQETIEGRDVGNWIEDISEWGWEDGIDKRGDLLINGAKLVHHQIINNK